MTRVLIAAATAAEQAELATMLKARPTLDVIAPAPRAPLARQVAEQRPDVLLLALGDASVAPALRALPGTSRPLAVVLLAEEPRAAWNREARRAGVRAVLPRDVAADELLAAVDGAIIGLIVLHPDAADVAGARPARQREAPGGAQALTAREREILDMMAEGLGNKAIAARLGISPHTVKFHVASILLKLEAGSRTEAVTRGVRRGLVVV